MILISSIALVLVLAFVIGYDVKGKNKVIPAAVGVPVLIILALIGGHEFSHVVSAGFIESWQPAIFVIGATFLADYMQQSGAFRPLMKFIKTTFLLGVFTFIASMIVDNTAATSMSLNMAKPKRGRAAFATFAAIAALVGGVISIIGDITSTMAWIKGVVTAWGLLKLAPAAIITFLVYYFLVRKDIDLEFEGPTKNEAANPTLDWIKLIVGISMFALVPIMKLTLHWAPGATILLSASLGFLILRALSSHAFSYLPHKEERKSIFRTAGFIFFILFAVGTMHEAFTIAGNYVQDWDAGIIGGISVVVSALVDNIPWMAVLLQTLDFGVDSFEWLLIVFILGIAGGITNIGSTSSILSAEILGVKFGDYVKYAPKIIISILAGVVVIYGMYFIGLL